MDEIVEIRDNTHAMTSERNAMKNTIITITLFGYLANIGLAQIGLPPESISLPNHGSYGLSGLNSFLLLEPAAPKQEEYEEPNEGNNSPDKIWVTEISGFASLTGDENQGEKVTLEDDAICQMMAGSTTTSVSSNSSNSECTAIGALVYQDGNEQTYSKPMCFPEPSRPDPEENNDDSTGNSQNQTAEDTDNHDQEDMHNNHTNNEVLPDENDGNNYDETNDEVLNSNENVVNNGGNEYSENEDNGNGENYVDDEVYDNNQANNNGISNKQGDSGNDYNEDGDEDVFTYDTTYEKPGKGMISFDTDSFVITYDPSLDKPVPEGHIPLKSYNFNITYDSSLEVSQKQVDCSQYGDEIQNDENPGTFSNDGMLD